MRSLGWNVHPLAYSAQPRLMWVLKIELPLGGGIDTKVGT
jgi:hypothetical protein